MVLGIFQAASAQSITVGKLTGTIMDDQGAPLPGVTLEVTSPALMGKRATVSSARGTYFFLNLPVGTYTLTASMANFKTIVREKITISMAETIVVNILMEIGRIEESVTVTAASPIVDAKSSQVDSKLDSQMLDKLPTARNAFYDLSLTTPGMYDHGSVGGSLPSPTAYGGASNENVFLVNGVDATNPRGGSFGPLVRVNYNTVEEVRVIALGSKAEYGSYSGAAIDVLTKSGSNAFHGTAAYYFEPVKWRRSNAPGVTPAGQFAYGSNYIFVAPSTTLYGGPPQSDYEINFTAGGPIIKDRIWFYGGFDYLYNAGKRPRWDLLTHGWGRYGDLKITAEPFKANRAWVAYHYESNDYDGGSWGSQPEWDTSMTYGVASKNNTVSAQWQWLPLSTTIFTAKYLGFWTNDTPHVPSDAPANPGYINWWKWASYGIGGGFPYIEGWKSNRQTIQADMSHYAEDFLGEHDIKFGAQFTRGRSNSLGGYFQNYANFLYPYRWTQNVGYMQSWYGDTGLLFYNYHDAVNPFMTVATADSLGFFFDDQWAVSSRLTVNLGLRYDRMTSKYGAGDIYEPLTKPSDIANPTLLRKRAGTGNIFDFKTISPRIGLTYSLTDDGKTVARASYGRYYLPLMAEYLRRYGPDVPLVTRTIQMFNVPWSIADANGDGVIDTFETRDAARWITENKAAALISSTLQAPRDAFSWTLNVDPNLKDQYTDQFTLNLERELFQDFSVSLTGIYKHAGNIFANIPINRVTGQEWEYDRVPFTTLSGQTVMLYSIKWLDYNGDGAIDGKDVKWIGDNQTFRVTNMPSFDGKKPKRDYAALQLVFNKRYSERWQALASFVYAYSSGMGNRIFGNDMNAEGPMFYDNNWMGSLNYTINNLEGPLPFTPKFEFKVSGSYTVPYIELDLGVRFRMHTGRPLWRLEGYPQHTQWGNPPGGVIDGGIGSIVSGDPTKPAYLPTQTILDLRAEKMFKLGRYGNVGVILDMFNIFNADTPNSIDNQWEFGRVGGILEPRTFRLSFLYTF
jgi:hypothetical protein